MSSYLFEPVSNLPRVISEEIGQLHPRWFLAQFLITFLPDYTSTRIRTQILRMAGFKIGRGTTFWGKPYISGGGDLVQRLVIGEDCGINIHCLFDLGTSITLGKGVHLGHAVMLLTTSHEIGPSTQRAGPATTAPISIGDGVWIGSRSLILPGITMGTGAVVASGSVVTKDVAANTLVAGVPAKQVRHLAEENDALGVAP